MTEDLVVLARRAALAAGEHIMSSWAGSVDVAVKTSATDPVTDVDRACEALIRSIIAGERPDDAVIGEEAGRRGGASDLWWVIDPLDGTVNFIYRRDEVAVSVAAVDRRGPVASCVHAPRLAKTYTAARGRGAELNERALRLPETRALEHALIGTGFSYDAKGRRAQAEALVGILPSVADLRRGGSAALDICSVAQGGLDAFVEDDLAEWDWIGAALVVREAGGIVTPFTSARGTPGVAAGPSVLVDALVRLSGGTVS